MGRNPINIRINGQKLKEILKSHDCTFSERAASYGVSKQAINGWFTTNRAPPRALIEMAIDLKLSKEEVDDIIVHTREEVTDEVKPKRRWKITVEEE